VRKRNKRLFILSLCTFLFISLTSFFFIGASNSTVKIAPINPAFLKYLENAKRGVVRLFSAEGYPLGELPAPVDLSHIKGPVYKRREISYPPTYDLRLLDKLTPVKNQGSCGSCWTFATYGSLESYLMPIVWNFSEQDLNANHGFDYLECEGGNALMSTAYLARWSGPLNKSDVPYPYSSSYIMSNGFSPQKHIQQVAFLPARANPSDNDTIKYFVTTYGAIYVSMTWDSSYYNSSTFSYYYNATDSQNHGVCIVGWNDNYDKYDFNITPPGDGAFIVRNSWGTSWGEEGYFYISYYDTNLSPVASFNNAEATDNYSHIYQYDPLGWVVDFGGTDTVYWGANIFTALDDQPLQAISFYSNDLNVNITIHIYKNISGSSDPTNGTLASTKTAFYTYPGYHTVLLDSPVDLSIEERFSVVIKFENSSYEYPIAIEYPYPGYSSNATANPGESFTSSDGINWNDITYSYSDTNVCIKAFSICPLPGIPSDPSPADGATGVALSPTLSWTSTDASSWDVYFGTSSPPPKVATVSTTSYAPGTLNYGTQYFWKVVALNACGSTEGSVWSFTTQQGILNYTLTISDTTGGTTNPSPGTYTYESGTEVEITAIPDSSYYFSRWSGDVPSGKEKDNPLLLTMDSDKSITANFNPVSEKECLLGTWSKQGVYYRDSDTGAWVKMATPATQVAAGNIDGDGVDDLLGIWPSQGAPSPIYRTSRSVR